MNLFSKIKSCLLLASFFVYTTALSAEFQSVENSLFLHVVNEKFASTNFELRESVDGFLKEVWKEAVSTGAHDIHEISRIGYEKLNSKSGAAKSLYEKGLRLATSSIYTPTSDYNDTYSSIARYRGDSVSDWNGQDHSLIIVFGNFALKKRDLNNVQTGYDPAQGNILRFVRFSADFGDFSENLYNLTKNMRDSYIKNIRNR